MELEYFGPVFGRPHGVPLPWLADDAEPNSDIWATSEQSRDEIVGLYHQAWQNADETIDALPLDAIGRVIDGAAGLLQESNNLPAVDQEWWRDYSSRVEQAACGAAG